MMNQKEDMIIVLLDLKRPWQDQNYLIIVIHTYFLIRTITVPNTAAAGAAVNNTNEKVILKNCALFTACISEINNTQVGDGQKNDAVMAMYNLKHQEFCGNTIETNQL